MTKRKDPKNDDKKPKQSKKAAKTADLEQKIDELTNILQRERADSENLRRRHDSQITDLKKYVKAEVVKDLLPAIDNLDRALNHTPEDLVGSDYVKGVEGVAKQFASTLQKLGVEKIPTTGKEFNPDLHEAVSMDDSGSGKKEVVSEELQSGYMVDGQVIRHAMVRVKLG